MKLENLPLNKATQIFAKAPFFLKIGIFLLICFGAPCAHVWGEEVKTRWFTAQIEPEWVAIPDPHGIALLILQHTKESGINLNIIRSPGTRKVPTSQLILADYKSAGFRDIEIKRLDQLTANEAGESSVVTYSTGGQTTSTGHENGRLSVVGRWPTLDESTLWVTVTAPPEAQDQAVDLYKKFLTRLKVTVPTSDTTSSQNSWQRFFVVTTLIVTSLFILAFARRYVARSQRS